MSTNLVFLGDAEPRTFDWEVTVHVPGEGKRQFQARFLDLTQDEIDTITAEGPRADETLLQRVLLDWDGIEDGGGAPLAYTEETRDQLIARPYIRYAVARAYLLAIQGGEADEKN